MASGTGSAILSEHTREGRRMSEAERAEREAVVIQLKSQGMSLSQIGQHIDRTRERVRQILVKAGEGERSEE